jgi:phosphatidylserine/phosphatidylglycerophosphate/cardiolipin synthase-like enzyme
MLLRSPRKGCRRLRSRVVLAAVVLLLAACAPPPRALESVTPPPLPPGARLSGTLGPLEFVQSVPDESGLERPGWRTAAEVWPELIESASHRIALGQFYAASVPEGALEPVIAALGAAAARGVDVQFLTEQAFYERDPTTVDRIAALPGVTVRRLPTAETMGGVMHAKYFVVDGEVAFVGSQNFDWRALSHNLELGLVIRLPGVVSAFQAVFDADWALAVGEGPLTGPRPPDPALDSGPPSFASVSTPEGTLLIRAGLSPRGYLPDDATWDLPGLTAMIRAARRSVRVQVMTYGLTGYDGRIDRTLDDALRAAAGRGVEVMLLVADWNQRGERLEDLRALQRDSAVQVRFITIPQYSGGFIPYARVAHAKFMVVDGARSWLGSSNWSPGYFFDSRNVGVFVEGAPFAARLVEVFDDLWRSPYTEPLDPDKEYTPPRVQ